MADTLELKAQWQGLQRVGFGGFEVAVFGHLRKHDVAPVQHHLGAPQGVVQGTVFQHAHEHRRLLDVQIGSALVEVDVGRAFDAHGLVDEVVAVEVQRHDFFLRVVAFQPRSDDPLLGFLQHGTLKKAGGLVLVGEQQFGQLLGDRGPSPSFAHVSDGARQPDEIHARVAVVAGVFGGQKGIHQMRRQGLEAGVGSVLGVVASQHLAIHGIHPGGQVRLGVRQRLGVWQIAGHGQQHQSRQAKQGAEAHKPQQQFPWNALHGTKLQPRSLRAWDVSNRCEQGCVNSSQSTRRRTYLCA